MNGDALTTKARIKDRLQITVTSFDDFLDNLILAITKRITQMCNRTSFLQAEYNNQLYDGSNTTGTSRYILVLKNSPILALESVEYKTGLNSSPTWTEIDEDDYDVDMEAGILYFSSLPRGRQNIRVSYTAGYSGYAIGLTNIWTFNVTPTGTVNGSNRTFTLPVDASGIIVYADGLRISPSNYSFTADTDTFTLAVGQAPHSTISVDYVNAGIESDDPVLPADLVEVCEEAVVRIFKRRDSEGRTSESFQESSVTWSEDIFTKENRATIKNYRRGTFI